MTFSSHGKILRCLALIRLLQTKRVSIEEIAAAADCSRRTAYRYLGTFCESGFTVMKDGNQFYIKNGKI